MNEEALRAKTEIMDKDSVNVIIKLKYSDKYNLYQQPFVLLKNNFDGTTHEKEKRGGPITSSNR